MRKWQWINGLVGLVAAAALPVAGHWIRGQSKDRCGFDGMTIQLAFRVRVFSQRGEAEQFCCVRCAELWLERRKTEPAAVNVTDEVTAREIDSSLAYFVRSSVVTTPHTGNRIHVFRSRSDSEKHASVAKGTVLLEKDRPLQLRK